MKAMYQKVFEEGYAVVKKIQETQEDAIKQCARLIADAYISNHTFFVSGSGHSHTCLLYTSCRGSTRFGSLLHHKIYKFARDADSLDDRLALDVLCLLYTSL